MIINVFETNFKLFKESPNWNLLQCNQQFIENITKIYGDFQEGEYSKIFENKGFGYAKVTVERPERNDKGQVVTDKKGNPKPDSSLRDTENIPLLMDMQEYMEKEVLPHVPDAWVDHSKTNIGYEINFTKYFYQYKPLRSLEEIRKDILAIEQETDGLLKEIIG